MSPAPETLPRFDAEIRAFTAQDQKTPPPANPIVFVGSSTIRLWNDLESDFAPLPVVNRGFGGSFLWESVCYADQIITNYNPRAVVVYAGENDLGNGVNADTVFQDFKKLVAKIHATCPQTSVCFLSVKPSPGRAPYLEEIQRANDLIQPWIQTQPLVHYIDVATPMMDEKRVGRWKYFVEDGVHMQRSGYELWTSIVKPYLMGLF